MLKGPVVCRLRFFGKTAGGKLPRLEVIGKALTADALSRTRLITAVAPGKVLLLAALHGIYLRRYLCRVSEGIDTTISPRRST
jgi:hypothetical protein